MNELKIFENPQFGQIRVIEQGGEPWFVAADVCRALELANTTMTLDRLDDDERSKFNLGRQGDTWCVNEPGLYSLVLGSRKPEAKAFKRWITHEVIPSIRKTGGYISGQESMTPEELMASALTVAQKVLAEREARLSALEAEKQQLQADLDRSKEWYSIKRVASINGCSFRRFDWRKLKRESIAQGYGVKKIFDANYGEVNVYHMNVWERVYPEAEL